MGNSKIMAAAVLSLVLLSGCSNSLPKDQVPMGDGPLSASTPSGSASPGTGTSSPAKTGSSASVNGDKTVPQSTILPGTVDNPDQRNQHLAPAPSSTLAPSGTGGSGEIIDGARDSVGAGSKDDKRQAAESFLAFVSLMNAKNYAGACAYIKLTPAQGTDCLAAMDKLGAKSRTYPSGLKIDRLDNGVIDGDTATLDKLVFVYDGDKRIRDVTMFRPADGTGKWKTPL